LNRTHAKEHGMRQIVSVNPFSCRMWSEHERLQEYINEEGCKAEIESFQMHGQLLPVLGRPLRGDPNHEIELIYGARRLFVARHLNMQLRAEIREITDREAIVAIDIENRQRQEVSAYERGCSYQSWLRGNYFNTQEDLARTLGVSSSQVSRLMKLAQVPPVLVNAFGSPFEICETWAPELHEAWQNPELRRVMLRRARALAQQSPRPAGSKVFQELIAGPKRARRSGTKVRDEVVSGRNGEPAFRIRYQPRTIALLLPSERVSSKQLEQIKSSLYSILQPETLQAPVVPMELPQRTFAKQSRMAESVARIEPGNGTAAP
jgi:ParB family chromosome partitioning protein